MIFSLVVFLHFAAVINIFLGMAEDGWILKDGDGIPLEHPWDLYVSQYYFVTTTMTTVGYGDVSAKKIGDGSAQVDGNNMNAIMMLQFTSMAVFALIKQTLFSLEFKKSANQIISMRKNFAHSYLDEINK